MCCFGARFNGVHMCVCSCSAALWCIGWAVSRLLRKIAACSASSRLLRNNGSQALLSPQRYEGFIFSTISSCCMGGLLQCVSLPPVSLAENRRHDVFCSVCFRWGVLTLVPTGPVALPRVSVLQQLALDLFGEQLLLVVVCPLQGAVWRQLQLITNSWWQCCCVFC